MPYRKRRDHPGDWFHVMNRGIARRTMFEQRADVEFFLGLVGEVVAKGWLEVHAFTVLMTHFHMLVRSPQGEMARAMRHVQLAYSRYFNLTRRRDGSLVRGRYRSKLVESTRYRRVLVGYIDANAQRAGLARTAAAYPFGSCRAYVTGGGPDWLSRSWVQAEVCAVTGLRRYDGARYAEVFQRDFTDAHCQLVELRIRSGVDVGDPTDSLLAGVSDRMMRWLRRKALLADGTLPGIGIVPVAAVREAVSRARIRPPRKPAHRLRRTDWPRAVLAHLWRDLAGLTYSEIGALLHGSRELARDLVARARTMLLEDREFARQVVSCAALAVESTYGSAATLP